MSDDDLGRLSGRHGEWTLTFVRVVPHPPDKVWRAITEPEHLAAWFPQRIVGDRRAGARLRFVTDGEGDASAGEGFDGEMLVYEPPAVMELAWGEDRLRIELEAEGAGTRITLVDTFGELGKGARDAAGWHECLDRLVATLSGRPSPEWGVAWSEVHPAYVERFGPEAATIGPPDS